MPGGPSAPSASISPRPLPAPQQQSPQQQAAAAAYISARLAAAEVARVEPTAQVTEGGQNISPIFLKNTMQKKQCYAYDSSALVDLRSCLCVPQICLRVHRVIAGLLRYNCWDKDPSGLATSARFELLVWHYGEYISCRINRWICPWDTSMSDRMHHGPPHPRHSWTITCL